MRQISYIEQRRVLQNLFAAKAQAERIVNNIGRATRKHYCAEDKIRILLGLPPIYRRTGQITSG